MNAPAKKLEPATLADLLAAPEDDRLELVDGALRPKGATDPTHGAAQRKLSALVDPFERRPGGRYPGGWWFATETDIWFDERHTFLPDIAGWRRDRVPVRPAVRPVRDRPDWVCEILSTNRRNDLIQKKRVYHRCGVPNYWVLDPESAMLTVYRWTETAYLEILEAQRGERVRAEPFGEIEISIGVLFGDDPEDD